MDIVVKTALQDMSYISLVQDILENKQYKQLGYCTHHTHLTRLVHCIHVSYSCYLKAKKIKYAYIRELVRGALLHDFFLYDYRTEKGIKKHWLHGLFHPKASLIEAERQFKLNDIERNLILTHMFPLSFHIPRTRASWLVIFYDKYWAIKEKFSKQ